MIGYLLKNPPYESKAMNIIEIANEVVIITCQYYLLCFAQDLQSEELKAQLGLGFSVLVLLQFSASLIALVATKIVKYIPTVLSLLKKAKDFIQAKVMSKI